MAWGLVMAVCATTVLAAYVPYQMREDERKAESRRYSLHRLYASLSQPGTCPQYSLDDPPANPLEASGFCIFDQSASCTDDDEAVAQAGLPMDTYCGALYEPGGCLDAARTFGVSAPCLCSLVISERSWSDHDLFTKKWTDEAGLGATVGCIQQSPHTIWEAIQKLRKCQPQALRKFKQLNLFTATEAEIRTLLMESCPTATQLAALWLLAQAHPDCNGGKPGTCMSFAENWNPGDGGRLNGGSRGLLNFGPEIRFKAQLAFGILKNKPEVKSDGLPGSVWARTSVRMSYGPQKNQIGPPWPIPASWLNRRGLEEATRPPSER